MDCQQAQRYFDAYLDGELPPALETEFGAHRVRCSDCRRALALMEVSGHILASDREPVTLDDDFSHRLLACMDSRQHGWVGNWRRIALFATPVAAAAALVFAFLGPFSQSRDEHPTKVLGVKEYQQYSLTDVLSEIDDKSQEEAGGGPVDSKQANRGPRHSGRSVQSLQIYLDRMLEQAEATAEEAAEGVDDAEPSQEREGKSRSDGEPGTPSESAPTPR